MLYEIIKSPEMVGEGISYKLACKLFEESDVVDLVLAADKVRKKTRGKRIDLCSIINAKSGRCVQDCKFCAQSIYHNTDIREYPLLQPEEILEFAGKMENEGAHRFSIVTSGKSINDSEFDMICETLQKLKNRTNLKLCASLGVLDKKKLKKLANLGVRYHHNLETAKSHFNKICTTHSFHERIETIKTAKKIGMDVCAGGILGLGETFQQRLEFAFTLKDLDVDSVPINILNPIKGTRMENAKPLPPLEVIKTVAILRLILPDKEIRYCGGREHNLRDLQSLGILAGADGLMIGDYLTTSGRSPKEDIQMIKDLGFSV